MIDLTIVFILIDTGEIVSINDPNAVTLLHELQGLIHILHLVVVRMRCAVGSQQSVDAEGIEVRLVAIVTTISPKLSIAIFLQKSLVHPVPDSSTDDATVGIDDIPILLQVTHRVTHSVSIFAGYHGFLGFFDGLAAQFVGCWIAKVVEGRVARMTIVEGWTGSVELAHLVVHRLNVRTHSALVAQAPQNDTGMVEVALHQRFCTVHMSLLPCEVVPHLLVGIAVAMTLLICLVHHVNSPAIAKLI